jgi:hypothetical protein
VAFDPLIINRDDIPKRTRCRLSHGGSFLLSWLRLATTSSARFGPPALPSCAKDFLRYRRHLPAKVRVFIDALVTLFADQQWFTANNQSNSIDLSGAQSRQAEASALGNPCNCLCLGDAPSIQQATRGLRC